MKFYFIKITILADYITKRELKSCSPPLKFQSAFLQQQTPALSASFPELLRRDSRTAKD